MYILRLRTQPLANISGVQGRAGHRYHLLREIYFACLLVGGFLFFWKKSLLHARMTSEGLEAEKQTENETAEGVHVTCELGTLKIPVKIKLLFPAHQLGFTRE